MTEPCSTLVGAINQGGPQPPDFRVSESC